MGIKLDEILTGSGDFDLGNTQVAWMDIRVTAAGDAHKLAPGVDEDRYARLGWVSFGYGEDPEEDGFRNFWRAPIWIEFLDFHWSPVPQYFGGDLVIWSNRFRYSLAEGAEAHVWVYGY